jgi:HSP20 family protein
MTIRRWDPLSDLLTLQERMNRLFEESLSRNRLPDEALSSGAWVPLADVYETAEGFVVQVELAGLGPEDVEVQVDGEGLVLRGERRMTSQARPEAFHRMERSYGAFTRSFRFTADVDPERVTAHFHGGLLRLELPKVRSREARIRAERAE